MKKYRRRPVVALAMGVLVWSGLMTGCGWKGLFGGVGAKKIQVQTHYTETSDGWRLQVDRYQPTKPDPANNPVVLCHGLSYNNRFWDLTKKTSLARYLAERGYDVWTVSLRGAGLS
ncbi:MAG: hypothetical protein KAT11_06050, partial [Phycisphaerae bacterium]|nr:hypothetical protein [Phycisphaerae bacterium]